MYSMDTAQKRNMKVLGARQHIESKQNDIFVLQFRPKKQQFSGALPMP